MPMCLIIHKPKGWRVPENLIASAIEYNPDGYGFMGIDSRGPAVVHRGLKPDTAELRALTEQFEQGECVLHLRRQTRGDAGIDNVHPFRVADELYMMHNGTLPLESRIAGRSDTWHFAQDFLAPLLASHPGLVGDPALRRIIEAWIGPHNKLVFLDARERRIHLYNESLGCLYQGLWLSNSRWVDCRGLGLPMPQARDLVRRGAEVQFM